MFIFRTFSCDLLILHVTLLQNGVHYIMVHCRHMDIHINVNGNQVSALGLPEVDLQMAPNTQNL